MKCCDAIDPAEGGCKAWVGENKAPWPWHGCSLDPLPTDRHRHRHQCKCGHEWGGSAGRSPLSQSPRRQR